MSIPENRVLELDSGRRLGFHIYGDPQGTPLFYFHGFPGSRLEAAFADTMLRENGVCLVAAERPGYGLSDPLPDRQLMDWPQDIAALASALEFPRFGVLGVSVGSCYALACARAIPERLTYLGIAGALSPLAEVNLLADMGFLSRYCFASSRHDTQLSRWVYGRMLGWLTRHGTGGFLKLLQLFSRHADRRALSDPGFLEAVRSSMKEAYRQGWRGPYQDLVCVTGDWGFRLAEISMPVHLWHGEEDATVPVSMANHLAGALPECRARILPGHGHFSITQEYMEEAVQVLTGQRPGADKLETSCIPPCEDPKREAASC